MLRTAVRVLAIVAITIAVPALALEHATEGIISKVDKAGKTIAVKTADGGEEVFKFTGHTALRAAQGVRTGAVDSYLAGKEGTHVVVHYTGEGAEKTAVALDDLGKNTVKVSQGTVTSLDKTGHTLTVKTEDGSEHTYRVAKDAAVDSEHGVVKGTEYTAKKGEKVSVHYTEEAGEKVAHFIKHM